MANEVTYTGSGGNLRAAEIFNRFIHEDLVDRTDLRSLAVRLGDLGGSGSDTLVTPRIAWDDAMAAANTDETTAAGNTALGNSAISLSVAQQIISYELSDKMLITGSAGHLDLEMIARKIVDAYILRFTDQVCALFTSFTAIVSSTGVDMDVDDFYDAIFALEQAVVPGPFDCVLYTVQYTDLQSSIRGEGGAAQWMPGTQNQLLAKSPGYKGEFMGVRVWATDSVGTDGPDSNGAMYGEGAVVYAEASPRAAMPGAIQASVPAGSPVYAEFVRTGDPGLSAIVGHAFNAVGIGENARGVEIKTDR
jgi:hypothetical protein